ncbi:MAG: SH3 domain-containing protein [Leptonema sp. (in: Bacteria)]|nr:SH3 domain-containing protein [Leptonema sp. (in: bacteria)]
MFGCHEQAGPGLFEASVLYGNADAGILRTDPTTYGFEIGIVKKGEAVKVINRTDGKVRIGKSNDYWYFVKKENNLKGWIYGTALSRISTGEDEEVVEGPDMVVVQANLPGIWWEQNQDGSTGFRRIEFIPEGTEEKPTTKKGEHSEQAETLKTEEAPTEVILTDKGKFQYFYGKTPGAVLKYTIDAKTRKIILAQESPIGRELEFIDVGEEYRMTSAKGDKKFSFKKGYKTEEVDG